MKGTLITCSLSELRDIKNFNADAKFLITLTQKNNINGVIHLPHLAPNPTLFRLLKQSRDFEYRQMILEKFREYTYNSTFRHNMNLIKKMLDDGKNIIMMCYCSGLDADICHRKIIAEEFEKLGCNVIQIRKE